MSINKIGICTVFTGYNYGSSLQAFATKELLSDLGYKPVLLKLKGSVIAGRDIRIKKAFIILARSIICARNIKGVLAYKTIVTKKLSQETKKRFDIFTKHFLAPESISYKNLKKIACKEEYKKFVCGSDQIWNASAYYVDPFYYLRFAPKYKRIAFAPSFGRAELPSYNKKCIAKYVSDIQFCSVRELSGQNIIKEIIGKNVDVLIDPTLVITKEEWIKKLNIKVNKSRKEKYLLAYFLDNPSNKTICFIRELSIFLGLKIITIPFNYENICWKARCVSIGPSEFIELVANADFICTDSFHGTAFSINFNKPFYTFERNYGRAEKQSSRIESILSQTGLLKRYEPCDMKDCYEISFEKANSVLEKERIHSKEFLVSAVERCCANV